MVLNFLQIAFISTYFDKIILSMRIVSKKSCHGQYNENGDVAGNFPDSPRKHGALGSAAPW